MAQAVDFLKETTTAASRADSKMDTATAVMEAGCPEAWRGLVYDLYEFEGRTRPSRSFPAQALTIARLARKHKLTRALDIGCGPGLRILPVMKAMSEGSPGARLLYDAYDFKVPEVERRNATELLRSVAAKNSVSIEGLSIQCVEKLDKEALVGPYDLVMIDVGAGRLVSALKMVLGSSCVRPGTYVFLEGVDAPVSDHTHLRVGDLLASVAGGRFVPLRRGLDSFTCHGLGAFVVTEGRADEHPSLPPQS